MSLNALHYTNTIPEYVDIVFTLGRMVVASSEPTRHHIYIAVGKGKDFVGYREVATKLGALGDPREWCGKVMTERSNKRHKTIQDLKREIALLELERAAYKASRKAWVKSA